jgi:hypothetical protein
LGTGKRAIAAIALFDILNVENIKWHGKKIVLLDGWLAPEEAAIAIDSFFRIGVWIN